MFTPSAAASLATTPNDSAVIGLPSTTMVWVDGSRIGINGWSYGGFMTSYALTHSKSFAMGIAGGTVADWKDYDSIYTERYMWMPQENNAGYDASSAMTYAKDLKGRLLIYYGTADNNVHPSNSLQLIKALQDAGTKAFLEHALANGERLAGAAGLAPLAANDYRQARERLAGQ